MHRYILKEREGASMRERERERDSVISLGLWLQNKSQNKNFYFQDVNCGPNAECKHEVRSSTQY